MCGGGKSAQIGTVQPNPPSFGCRIVRSPGAVHVIATDPPHEAQRVRRLSAALFAPLLGAFLCALLLYLPAEMSPDGWFALLSGHEIVAHGLPTHDALIVWGHGRRWVDQQWLAQLAYYGLYSLGGLRLALIVNAAVVTGAFAAAIAVARSFGGSRLSTLGVAIPAGFVIGWHASALRPQAFTLPLFVALTWLLVSDARAQSRRVFLVVPLLALWANLHGTVVLAALMVVVYAASSVASHRRVALRDAGLAASAALLPFASPYAPHLPGYYHELLFNSQLAQYVPDWRPTALSGVTAAFYLLALLAIFVLGRARGSATLFERVLLVLLLILGVEATRGMPWFALFALATLPDMITGIAQRELRITSRRQAGVLIGVSAAAVCLAALFVVLKPASWYTTSYPTTVSRSVVAAAAPSSRVFANGAYSDWLLLVEPKLRGRIAYDARFELLPHGRLADAAAVSLGRSDWRRILSPFDVVVLRPEEVEMRNELLRAGGWNRVSGDRHVVVLRRST